MIAGMSTRLVLALLLLIDLGGAQTLRIRNVMVYDGSGKAPFRGEVRVEGDHISALGKTLKPVAGEMVRDGKGRALAPGFIDMHSHADRGIFEDSGDNVVRQGITTVFVGQDGGSPFPLKDFLERLDAHPAQMNVAGMAGHATLREQVMGKDLLRAATPMEVGKMRALLAQEMRAGAFGLSSGLEYEEGHFATTEEMVELAKVASRAGGFYISHVRDEGNDVFKSFDEVLEIGKRAHIAVEISHIKLGTTPVWHMAKEKMPKIFARARREGVDLKADVYPYTYWQSTLRVIVLDRDFYNPEKVRKAIAENGGAERIRVTRYDPEAAQSGKTLDQIAAAWKLTPVEAFMKIVKATLPNGEFKGAEEHVIVESIHEDDLRWFLAAPQIMFCTDGELHGKHPRGAGSFPRILGRYVREQHVLPLREAIRKASAMPAQQLGLQDRGRIAAGYKADLVLFDPAKVLDQATVENPEAPPLGIDSVMVNGKWVVDEGVVTKERPGKGLRKQSLAVGR